MTVQPSLKSVEPSVMTVEPGVMAVQPSLKSVEPGVMTVEPGVMAVQPSLKSVEPGVMTVEPGVMAVQAFGQPALRTTNLRADGGQDAVLDARHVNLEIEQRLIGVLHVTKWHVTAFGGCC